MAKLLPLGGGGTIPWHPHHMVRLGNAVSLSVDLADGHVDVSVPGLTLPGRGPDLRANQTWDSALAQNGGSSGLVSSLTPHMSGVLTGTVTYTDRSGAVWDLSYLGALTATAPYTAYRLPPGQPWQLTTSTGGYTLTDFLTGETWTFDGQGRLVSDTDSYGNTNTLSYGSTGPTQEHNSGGRMLAVATNASGQLTDVQSPLWQQGGASQAGSQHVTYAYTGSGQLSGVTRGAGTSDAVTATFGYSGTQLISITTPYTQATRTWTLSYDGQGRVIGVTSPVSGTPGQAGYTPAYTTQYTYNPGQTVVVAGVGTSGALTTTDTLDGQGQATAVTDGLGHATQTSYDGDHDVTSRTDANNHTTTNYYQYVGPTGSVGLITQTVAPSITVYSPQNTQLSPISTTYHYDPTTYDLIETDKPEGGIVKSGYDGHHSVITTTETTNLSECTPSPCAHVWRGSITHYDQYGERSSTTDGRGVSVDSSGNATLNDPNGLYTSQTGYDAQGDVITSTTPSITTTLNGQTRSGPVSTTYGYDADGNQTRTTSANGATSTTGYDHLGRQVSVTAPSVTLYTGQTASPTQTTGYDGDGNIVRETDANGASTLSSYDPLGRLIAQTTPSGTTLYTYNATEQTSVQDALGNTTTSQYDAAGRLIQQTSPVSGTVQDGYDAVGNTIAITRGATSGVITQTETITYNALNAPITDTLSGPRGPTVSTLTAYDHDGNAVQIERPNGDVVYTTYDTADQLRAVEIDPQPVSQPTSTSYETYSYDGAGNMTLHTDADGRTSTTQYDGDNRAVQQVDATSAPTGTTTITTTPSYDPNGNTITQTTQTRDTTTPGVLQTHTYTDTYNAADWVTSSGDDGKAVSYGYDAAGQMRTQTQYDPTTLTLALDPEGRVTGIGESTNGTGPYTSTFGYNADDLLTTVTLPGGVQQVAQYDPASRLTSLTTTGASGLSPSTYRYGYNALDGTTSATGISGTDTLTHDALGRLTAESGPSVLSSIPGQTYQWSYDGNGNILTATDDFGGVYTNTYSQTQPNELLQSYDPGPSYATHSTTYYGYDRHGETTAITTSGVLTSSGAISTGISYDAQERPLTLTHKDDDYSTTAGAVFDTISQSYNADGLRSRYTVVVSGTAILDQRFSYRDDGSIGQVVALTATLNSNGSVKNTGAYTDTFVYDQTGLPLEFVRVTNGQIKRYWYILDGRDNVVAVTDSSGTVVDSYAYDSWGEPLPGLTKQQVPQQLRYASYWQDDAVGWYWVTTRYYDPELMRWMQPDPSEQDGVNTYAYVSDDPVDFIDPSGLRQYSIWAAAFIAPSSIRFIDPLRGDLNARVHGDGRGFWNGYSPIPWQRNGRPSSRIWNYVVIDDNPSASPVVRNLSGMGRSEIWYRNFTGSGGPDVGYTNKPALAKVKRYTDNRGYIHTWVVIQAEAGIPIVRPYAPPIKYQYLLDFDPQEGKLTVYGTHSAYPWHELLIKEGGKVISGKGSPWQFTPAKGASPLSLFPINGDSVYAAPWANVVTLTISRD